MKLGFLFKTQAILTGLSCFLTCATCLAQDAATSVSNKGSRLFEFASGSLYDGSLEFTGVVREDKYFDLVSASTPTTPSAKHSRIFLNNTLKNVCAVFDDASQQCFGTNVTGFLTTSSATATYLQLSSATATYLQPNNVVAGTGISVSGTTTKTIAVDGTIVKQSSAAFTSAINMQSHQINNLSNGSASADAVAFGQLAIFQVVMFSTTTTTSTTSATFQDTKLQATITTTGSHRVAVFVSGDLQAATNSTTAEATIRRTSNLVGADGLAVFRPSAAATSRGMGSFVYVDSPGAGSATYTVQVRSSDGASTVAFDGGGETSVLILAEIL